MTREEAGRLVAVFKAAWPNHPVPNAEALVTAWEIALADVPYGMAQQAAAMYLREGRFFPAPAEIRTLVIDRLGILPDGGEAWRMVLDRMRSTYPGREAAPWAIPEAVRLAVEAVGGLHTLRMSDEPGADQARFLKVYGTYRQRAARELDVALLITGGERTAIRGEAMTVEERTAFRDLSGKEVGL